MLTPRKSAAAIRAVALVLFAVAIGGCSLNTDVGQGPSTMVITSGDEQTGPPNTALPVALSVVVVNQFGEPLEDVTINWSIDSGGGSLSASSSQSDVNGAASVTYTTGPTAGRAVVTARVGGLPPLSFTLTISSS
jgi:hypothetical protein